jgi:hypothetical protein
MCPIKCQKELNMAKVIKKAESWLEKFENSLEKFADRLL